MAHIIAVANQKGGVGKTTTTVNLGACLANLGKKILIVDADAQGNATSGVGVQKAQVEKDIYDVLVNEEPITEAILPTKHKNMSIVPATIQLAGAEIELTSQMAREMRLKLGLHPVEDQYDYILIDCMPSLGMMTINALACADSVLIPVQAAYLPVKGLQQLIKTIGRVKKQLNPKLKIEGILLTMVDNRTNYAKDISALVVEDYGSKVRIFENSIPMSVRAAEISAEGVSIYEHDPNGKVASAYQSLTEEVLADE